MSADHPSSAAWLHERLAADGHIHSTFSDGTSDPAANLRAGIAAGLVDMVMTDHVRAGTTWLPAYVAAVDRLRLDVGIRVRVGVETKLMNTAGGLDLPAVLDGVELLLIADHQYPTSTGPVPPALIEDALRAGRTDPGTVVWGLADSLVAAISRLDRPAIIAHPFSILPKMGLTELDIPDDALRALASRCRETGTAVEVNEKWACPGPLVARALHASGVELVAGSDAHQSEAVGRYWHVRDVLGAVATAGVAA